MRVKSVGGVLLKDKRRSVYRFVQPGSDDLQCPAFDLSKADVVRRGK